jgi:hypothetical protein
MYKQTDSKHQLMMGLAMIALGSLLLLDRMTIISFSHAMRMYWPVLLILLGFLKLSRRDTTTPLGDNREKSL